MEGPQHRARGEGGGRLRIRQDLRAVKAGRVVVVDGDQMFNRPSPRLVDALEWLVGLFHGRPDIVPPTFPWVISLQSPFRMPRGS